MNVKTTSKDLGLTGQSAKSYDAGMIIVRQRIEADARAKATRELSAQTQWREFNARIAGKPTTPANAPGHHSRSFSQQPVHRVRRYSIPMFG